MKGTIEKGDLTQARARCKDCVALISKKGVWWCDEGNCPVQDVSRCTEWDNEATTPLESPHSDLVPDLVNGGWTMRKIEHPLPTSLDLVQRVFKLKAPTRTCPVHGEVWVLDKLFNKKDFCGTEGLSCGHTLLVSRRRNGLKKNRLHYLISDPRNWRFGGWALLFKETTLLS